MISKKLLNKMLKNGDFDTKIDLSSISDIQLIEELRQRGYVISGHKAGVKYI